MGSVRRHIGPVVQCGEFYTLHNSQVNEIWEARSRTEPKPFLPYCTISPISISAAEHIPPLLPVISTSVSHITEVPECIHAHVCPSQVCARVSDTTQNLPSRSEGVK